MSQPVHPDRAETLRRNLLAALKDQRRRLRHEPLPTMLDEEVRKRWDAERDAGQESKG